MVGFVGAHNDVRQGVGVSDLVWDQDLADDATEWLTFLIDERSCEMEHNYDSSHGENLGWNSGFESNPCTVVAGWLREVDYYDYETNTCTDACGHYTQLVWATTEKVGCALDICDDGSEIWMCNYSPAGNIPGEKPY